MRRNSSEHSAMPAYKGWEIQNDPATGKTLLVAPDGRETYNLANPDNYNSYTKNSVFAFQFGAYGGTRVLVFEQADHIDSALEAAGEWLSEHAPGHLSDLEQEYKDALEEAKAELGADAEELEERAQEIAETDMTYTESGWLNSSEWTVDELSRGDLYQVALYVAAALEAAEQNTYELYMKLPYGKSGAEADGVVIDREELLEMYAHAALGLTAEDVQKISRLNEDESVDLKAFRIERIG